MVEYEKFLSDLSAFNEEKLSIEDDAKVEEIAKKYKFEYDSKTGEFKGPDGKSHDLLAANRQVADLANGRTTIDEAGMNKILTDNVEVDKFSENLFGDKSPESVKQAKGILGNRVELEIMNNDVQAEVKPSIALEFVKEPTKPHVAAVEQIVGENGVKQTKDITTVEDLKKELAKTKTELQKSKIANFEYQQSLEEIKKTLDENGGKIQELADKTTAEMKKDGTWKDTAGKGLMVLLASFIAYVSIDELVDELSGCIVTTKKDGKIISKCKLDKFTCNPYKKEGVYPLCSSLQDFYDASSTDPSCLKNGKNYNDDDYFTSNECQDKGTDNDGTCNLCNSNNKCFTKNGEDGLTYEYSCVKVNAADALGYIMGGLINLVRDTTSAVFSSKWLWYMLGIVVGIMVLYLVFAYLRSRITGETSHFRYKR